MYIVHTDIKICTHRHLNMNTQTQKQSKNISLKFWPAIESQTVAVPAPLPRQFANLASAPIGCQIDTVIFIKVLQNQELIAIQNVFFLRNLLKSVLSALFIVGKWQMKKDDIIGQHWSLWHFWMKMSPSKHLFPPDQRQGTCLTNSKQNYCDQWCSASSGKTGARVQLHIWE